VGRELQKDDGQPPQIVCTVPLLEGLDGVEKMSKSKGNYIGITEAPKVMFRKVMSISDTLMWRYWELLTDVSLADITAMKAREPMQVKKELAARIVGDFHTKADAAQAADDFAREVQQGGVPSDIETVPVPDTARAPGGIHVSKLLVAIGLAPSRTEADRLVKAGSVEINGAKVADLVHAVEGRMTIRAGKKWKRVV
jgi:tyrosyl-tRNA synthetase